MTEEVTRPQVQQAWQRHLTAPPRAAQRASDDASACAEVASALMSGLDPVPAARALGGALAAAGGDVAQAIDACAAACASAGWAPAPARVVRAVIEGWALARGETDEVSTLIDAESGLSTPECFADALGLESSDDPWHGVAHRGVDAVVMLDVGIADADPWHRIARHAAVGAALLTVFGDVRPMARLGEGAFGVLVARGPELTLDLLRLRAALGALSRGRRTLTLVREPARIRVLGLPQARLEVAVAVGSWAD